MTLPAPLYYRWVFHPSSGDVDLDHNESDHPAFVKTHRHLPSGEGAVHGYAYRIHGGWRLTDYEHRRVSDPFIVAQVVQAIQNEDSHRQSSDGDWQEVNLDYDRLHYGRPVETKESNAIS